MARRTRGFADGGPISNVYAKKSLADKFTEAPGYASTFDPKFKPMVQDTSKMDTSADKAANAALAKKRGVSVESLFTGPKTPTPAATDTETKVRNAVKTAEGAAAQAETINAAKSKRRATKPAAEKSADAEIVVTGKKSGDAPINTSNSGMSTEQRTKAAHTVLARNQRQRDLADEVKARRGKGTAGGTGSSLQFNAPKTKKDNRKYTSEESLSRVGRGLGRLGKGLATFNPAAWAGRAIFDAKGGKVKKMATGGDVDNLEKNFDREFVSKEVVQDTSKMDRSADDAANAKLLAKRAKAKSGGGKPPDSKSAMGKPNAPTPSSKSRAANPRDVFGSGSSSKTEKSSLFPSGTRAPSSQIPKSAKQTEYPARRNMPSAKASSDYPNRAEFGPKPKSEGVLEKGRRLAKAAPGYAKGGAMKSEAADKNFKGKGNPFAKKGAKPFGKKSNPFGSNKAPPFGAKGKPFAKGGSIDGCAKRGHTKAKRSR